MAQRTVVTFTDDLDGSEAVGTFKFSVGDDRYEIDLSQENADHLLEVLQPYIDAARQVSGGRGRRGRRSGRSLSKRDSHAIRSWAQEQGYAVSSRGRIPREIIEAYQAAS